MDSPLPASGSSYSSTLIMTPAPLPRTHGLHLDLHALNGHHHHHRGPAPKGALGPHISNLPRRPVRKAAAGGGGGGLPVARVPLLVASQNIDQKGRRMNRKTKRLESESESESSASAPTTASVVVPSPIQLPRLPFPISGQVVDVVLERKEVPAREAVVVTEAQMRKRERCVQELGRKSGVFVAFSACHRTAVGGDAKDVLEEEEEGFDAVIRISAAASTDENSDAQEQEQEQRGIIHDVDTHTGVPTLRLVLPPPSPSPSSAGGAAPDDTGVPRLTTVQLRAACAFDAGHRRRRAQAQSPCPEDSHKADAADSSRAAHGRILVSAPRELAIEAFGVGVVLCLSLTTTAADASSDRDVDVDARRRAGAQDRGEADTDEDVDERVHSLVMGWHDLPQPGRELDSSASYVEDRSSSTASPEFRDDGGEGEGEVGLHDAWRGLLSREGMDYLARVLSGSSSSSASPTSTSTWTTSRASTARPEWDAGAATLARRLPAQQLRAPSSSVASARSDFGIDSPATPVGVSSP
ncbi:hypothetical protein C8F04DRAFT_1257582 [Mycena alexandri]|uniref:Uncharacterized protein n=1 Tax=Mycena alexandri TaxID=1745969 RepID=A0AAD6SZ07_9AGAR|nr:hypothetical protein C8F04DRAFT_1257582 [Mycena alexandri]